MPEPYIGEIRIFALSYAPRGWLYCNGGNVPISQFRALYGVIGTLYGGDGKRTFGLPNLQGLIPVNQGQGTGLSPYTMAQTGGAPTVKLQLAQIPKHIHSMNAAAPNRPANSSVPGANVILATASGATPYIPGTNNPPWAIMNSASIMPNGGNAEHNNLMPYLPLNFCIATQGLVPQRPTSDTPE